MRAKVSWVRHRLVVPGLLMLASVGFVDEVRYLYDYDDLNRLVG